MLSSISNSQIINISENVSGIQESNANKKNLKAGALVGIIVGIVVVVIAIIILIIFFVRKKSMEDKYECSEEADHEVTNSGLSNPLSEEGALTVVTESPLYDNENDPFLNSFEESFDLI